MNVFMDWKFENPQVKGQFFMFDYSTPVSHSIAALFCLNA